MKRFLISFLLIVTLVCNCSICVYASETSGGGFARPSSPTDTTGFDDWSNYDKFCWWKDNLLSLIGGGVGCIFNPLNWNYDHFMDYFHSAALDRQVADDSADYQDYIANRLGLNDSGEVVVQDDLMDLMFLATVEYVEEETGWYVLNTVPYSEISALGFDTQSEYDSLISYFKSLSVDSVVKIYTLCSDLDDYGADGTGQACRFYEFDSSDMFVDYKSSSTNWLNFIAYNSDWVTIDDYYNLYNMTSHNVTIDNAVKINNGYLRHWLPGTSNYAEECFFTQTGREIRIYKSVEDMKLYSVGQRPYYVADKFQDYDINGDNSCIISESDLSNGSVYGDVYNYIINNYDNPDGLTEDELRDILNDYFGQGSGGSGSGSGSGDSSGSGSSGGGLSGFLSGLGSLGDAILGILGKLIEYIGKAIDLITNGLTDIIDKIPKGVTDFMSAMFPFMPEEFFTALTLAMVLGVVCIVIKIFK